MLMRPSPFLIWYSEGDFGGSLLSASAASLFL